MGFYSVIVAATVPRCRLGQRNFAAVRRGHLSWIRRPSKWWDLHRLIDIFFHIFTYTYGNPYGFWWLICIDLWKLGAFSVSEKSFFLYRVPDPKPLASGIPRPRVPLVWAFWGKICWGIWVGFVAFWQFFWLLFVSFFKVLVHFETPFHVFCGGRFCKSLFFPLMKCKLLGDAEFRFARTLHGPFQWA